MHRLMMASAAALVTLGMTTPALAESEVWLRPWVDEGNWSRDTGPPFIWTAQTTCVALATGPGWRRAATPSPAAPTYIFRWRPGTSGMAVTNFRVRNASGRGPCAMTTAHGSLTFGGPRRHRTP